MNDTQKKCLTLSDVFHILQPSKPLPENWRDVGKPKKLTRIKVTKVFTGTLTKKGRRKYRRLKEELFQTDTETSYRFFD